MSSKIMNVFDSYVWVYVSAAQYVAQNDFLAFWMNPGTPVDIDGLDFGVIYGTAADKLLHNSQYVVIAENLKPEISNAGNPVTFISKLNLDADFFSGAILRFADAMSSGSEGTRSVDFSTPLRIESGRATLVLLSGPFLSAAPAQTFSIHLTVRGRVVSMEGGPTLRPFGGKVGR